MVRTDAELKKIKARYSRLYQIASDAEDATMCARGAWSRDLDNTELEIEFRFAEAKSMRAWWDLERFSKDVDLGLI